MEMFKILSRRKRLFSLLLILILVFNLILYYIKITDRWTEAQKLQKEVRREKIAESDAVRNRRLYPSWVLSNKTSSPIKPWNYNPNSAWTPLDGKRPRGSIWPLPQEQKIVKNKVCEFA